MNGKAFTWPTYLPRIESLQAGACGVRPVYLERHVLAESSLGSNGGGAWVHGLTVHQVLGLSSAFVAPLYMSGAVFLAVYVDVAHDRTKVNLVRCSVSLPAHAVGV